MTEWTGQPEQGSYLRWRLAGPVTFRINHPLVTQAGDGQGKSIIHLPSLGSAAGSCPWIRKGAPLVQILGALGMRKYDGVGTCRVRMVEITEEQGKDVSSVGSCSRDSVGTSPMGEEFCRVPESWGSSSSRGG